MIYFAQMPTRNVRFLLYTIHAHVDTETPVAYANLFRSMTALRGHHHEEGKRQIAIGSAYLSRERLVLVVYTGDKEKNLLLFDLRQQSELNLVTTEAQFQARKTHVVIDPDQRLLLIEAGRGRISAEELGEIIESEAHKTDEYKTLDLSFAPVAARGFVMALNQMGRIQSATVTIARPNLDWTDKYDMLAGLADDSKGRAIDTTIRARRGDGLSQDKGFIPAIKAWVSDKLSSVSSAKIKGEKTPDAGLTILNLKDYVEALNIPVEVKPETGQPVDSVVEEKLNSYLDSRGKGDDA